MGFVRDISQEKLRISINKLSGYLCSSHRQWSSSRRHILGMSWPCMLCPKGVCNVPEVDSDHVSSGGFTGCRTCDVMRIRVNRLPAATHRGAQCGSTTKSFVIASCSPGCCWTGWPHVRLLWDKSSWLGCHICWGFFVFWTKYRQSPTFCVFLYVLYASAGLEIKVNDRICYKFEWSKRQ